MVFSKSTRERLPWLWWPRARLQPTNNDDWLKVVIALSVALATSLLVVVALINER